MSELVVPLTVLALVDSTSFGTLLVPLWFLLAPGRLRPGRILAFLLTVAGFYLLLGTLLAAGATTLLEDVGRLAASGPARIFQLTVGIALIVVGLTMEPLTKAGKAKRATRRAEREARRGPGRLTRWRTRATDGSAPVTTVVTLAMTVAVIEAGSMLPYLTAIGLLAASDLSIVGTGAVLVGYCLVMIVPALTLLGVRLVLHARIVPTLSRLEGWMTRHSREATAWVAFLLGVYISVEAGALLTS